MKDWPWHKQFNIRLISIGVFSYVTMIAQHLRTFKIFTNIKNATLLIKKYASLSNLLIVRSDTRSYCTFLSISLGAWLRLWMSRVPSLKSKDLLVVSCWQNHYVVHGVDSFCKTSCDVLVQIVTYTHSRSFSRLLQVSSLLQKKSLNANEGALSIFKNYFKALKSCDRFYKDSSAGMSISCHTCFNHFLKESLNG